MQEIMIWELRKEPRFSVELTATVASESGAQATVDLVNLSLGGLQLRCNKKLMRAFAPKQERQSPQQQIIFNITLAFPMDKNFPLDLYCRVAHARRIESGEYLIGCQFENITAEGRKRISEYLTEFGIPE